MFTRRGQQIAPRPVAEIVRDTVAYSVTLANVSDEVLARTLGATTADGRGDIVMGLEVARAHLANELAAVERMLERVRALEPPKRAIAI